MVISEVSSYGENAVWVYRRKVRICDFDGGFFVPRKVVSVHHAVEIELSLNLVMISNDHGNFFRYHTYFWSRALME